MPQSRSTDFVGTNRSSNEKQVRMTQTPHMKPQTHKERATVMEEPPKNGHEENYWDAGGGRGERGGGFKLVVLALNSDAAPSYKYMFSLHSGPLLRVCIYHREQMLSFLNRPIIRKDLVCKSNQ